jgi:hypothetical protein
MKLCPNCGHRLGLLPRRWLRQLMCSHSCYVQVRARWWNGWKEELKQFFDPVSARTTVHTQELLGNSSSPDLVGGFFMYIVSSKRE